MEIGGLPRVCPQTGGVSAAGVGLLVEHDG